MTRRRLVLAATLGLGLMVAGPAWTQQASSPARQRGYEQGVKDGADFAPPHPAAPNLKTDSDRAAYWKGYQSGYCKDEAGRSGYYNGAYHDYAPPVLRNGYYGYNAPEPFCAEQTSPPSTPQSGRGASQNHIEYGGGG